MKLMQLFDIKSRIWRDAHFLSTLDQKYEFFVLSIFLTAYGKSDYFNCNFSNSVCRHYSIKKCRDELAELAQRGSGVEVSTQQN